MSPLTSQVAQAHAGTYTVENGKIKLLAEVGLIVDADALRHPWPRAPIGITSWRSLATAIAWC